MFLAMGVGRTMPIVVDLSDCYLNTLCNWLTHVLCVKSRVTILPAQIWVGSSKLRANP